MPILNRLSPESLANVCPEAGLRSRTFEMLAPSKEYPKVRYKDYVCILSISHLVHISTSQIHGFASTRLLHANIQYIFPSYGSTAVSIMSCTLADSSWSSGEAYSVLTAYAARSSSNLFWGQSAACFADHSR